MLKVRRLDYLARLEIEDQLVQVTELAVTNPMCLSS